MQPNKIDAVFEGGGVKGIGLVGALSVIERRGYTWANLAGTSAGAIVASLLAAGYTGPELKDLVGSLDYTRFKDPDWVGRIPAIGAVLNLLTGKGLYQGDYF